MKKTLKAMVSSVCAVTMLSVSAMPVSAEYSYIRCDDGLFDGVNIAEDVNIMGAYYDVKYDESDSVIGKRRSIMCSGGIYFTLKDGAEIPDAADFGLSENYKVMEYDWTENGYVVYPDRFKVTFGIMKSMMPYLCDKVLDNENVDEALVGYNVNHAEMFADGRITVTLKEDYKFDEADFEDIDYIEYFCNEEENTCTFTIRPYLSVMTEDIPAIKEACAKLKEIECCEKVDICGFSHALAITDEEDCMIMVPNNLLKKYEYIEDDVYRTKDSDTDEEILVKADYDNFCFNTISSGDATVDGTVDIRDVTMYARHIVKLDEIPSYADMVADLDGNGIIDIKDLSNVKSYLIGEKDSL